MYGWAALEPAPTSVVASATAGAATVASAQAPAIIALVLILK
jgi:hypothetical protein